jgi:hypothetical protein
MIYVIKLIILILGRKIPAIDLLTGWDDYSAKLAVTSGPPFIYCMVS